MQAKFVCRIRPPTDQEVQTYTKKLFDSKLLGATRSPRSNVHSPNRSTSSEKKGTPPKTSISQHNKNFFYSCFKNKAKPTIYLAEKTLSGNLINTSIMKDEINNKMLGSATMSYEFDQAFDETLSFSEIYSSCLKPMVKDFMQGTPVTFAVFGASGSGKTFSLRGNENSKKGLLLSAIKDILKQLSNINKKASKEGTPEKGLFLSILQLYKNSVYDLLTEDLSDKKVDRSIQIEVGKNGSLSKTRTRFIQAFEDANLALHHSISNRKFLSTKIGEKNLKEKSHFIVRFYLANVSKKKESFSEDDISGQMNIIDLADSNYTRNKGIKKPEAECLRANFENLNDYIVRLSKKRKKSRHSRSNSRSRSRSKSPADVSGMDPLIKSIKNTLKKSSRFVLFTCLSPCLEDLDSNLISLKYCCDLKDKIPLQPEKRKDQSKSPSKSTSYIDKSKEDSRVASSQNYDSQILINTSKSRETPKSATGLSLTESKETKRLRAWISELKKDMRFQSKVSGNEFDDFFISWVVEKENEIREFEKVLAQVSKSSDEYFIFAKDLNQIKTEISFMKERISQKNLFDSRQLDKSKKNLSSSEEYSLESQRKNASKDLKYNTESLPNAYPKADSPKSSKFKRDFDAAIREQEGESSTKKNTSGHSFKKNNEGTPKFENQMLEMFNPEKHAEKSRRRSEIKLDSIAKQVKWPEEEERDHQGNFKKGSTGYQADDLDMELRRLQQSGKLRSLKLSDKFRHSNYEARSDGSLTDSSSDIDNLLDADRTRGREWQKTLELKDKRSKMFNIIDHEEELLVENTLERMKKDRILKEFKTLFYKSKEIKEVMSEYAELNSKYVEDLKQKDKEIVKLTQGLKERKKEIKRNLKRENVERENLDKAREIISVLEEENLKLMGLSENYSKRISEQGLKLQYVQGKEDEYDYKVEELRQQLNSHKEQLLISLDNLEKSKETQRQMKDELEFKQNNVVRQLEEKIYVLEKELENKDQIIGDLEGVKENEMSRKEYQLTEFRSEFENIKRKLAAREAEIVELKRFNKEILDKKEDLLELITTYKDEKSQQEIKILTLSEQLEFERRNNQEMASRIKELEGSHLNLKGEKVNLENEMNQKAVLESKLSNVSRELANEKKTREKQKEELALVTQENELIKRTLNEKDTEYRQVKKELDRQRKETEKFEGQLDTISKSLKKSEKGYDKENSQLSKKLEEKAGEIRNLEEKLRNYESQNQNLTLQARDYKALYEEERGKSDNMLSTLKLELQQLIKEKEMIEDKNQELASRNEELEKAKGKMKNQLLMSKFEKQKIQEQYNEKENKLKKTFNMEKKMFEEELEKISSQKESEIETKKLRESKIQLLGDIQSLIQNHRKKRSDGF